MAPLGKRESRGTASTRTATARWAAVVVLLAIALLLVGATVTPDSALAATDYRTIVGTDRYHNSILVSQAGFAPGVEAVVVCNGTSYHSAVCSAPLAALHKGPVLLTPGDQLDARVSAEIGRLAPGKIFVVGLGPAVVDAIKAAYPELDASGSIITLRGGDASDTARLVAEQIQVKAGAVTGVVLVPSDPTLPYVGYSVSVAPLAAAKGWPILLTPVSGPLPAVTAQAIDDLDATFALRIANDYDLGIAGLTTKVLWGSNGYHTAALVADYAVSEGLDRSHVAVVTGYDGWCPWGLTIAPYLALDQGIAVVIAADQVPAEAASLLAGWATDIKKMDFSGPSAYTCESVKLVLASALSAIPKDYRSIVGTDRYHNSILVSQAGFAPGVEAVVVCNGTSYHSAVCSAPLAALHKGPVLLTPGDQLDARVSAEIGRLAPGKIFVVGLGPAVVDAIKAAYPELDASGSIITLRGGDASDTARLVAEQIQVKAGAVTGVVLVPSDPTLPYVGYSVSVAPLAAAKGWPILLTPVSGPLPAVTAQAIDDLDATFALRIANDYDLGIAGLTTKVLWGSNGYHTAALVADYAVSEGLDRSHVAVVTGYDGWCPWGLTIAPYLALDQGIAVVIAADQVPAEAASLLAGWATDIKKMDFSGPSAYTCEVVKLLVTTTGSPDGVSLTRVARGSRSADVFWLERRLTDLSYRPGPIDGMFDQKTYQAVIAFQKWEGLGRDGVMESGDWERLLAAARPRPKHIQLGTWIEVNRAKQVLLYCRNGLVVRTIPASTGSPRVGIATPGGTYTVTRENTWERVRYKPLYVRKRGVLAIHGYPRVPPYPASHGCIRIPIWDMDELHALVPVGTRVYVY